MYNPEISNICNPETTRKKTGSLLEQFNNPEEIEINQEKFKVIDIQPEKLKTEEPTLIIPGFSDTPEGLRDLIFETASSGRRVVSAYAPHGVKNSEMEHPDISISNAESKKMEFVLKLIEAKGFEKINVIAHSEGAIYVLAAAMMYPEKFSNIVLVEPAGLIGEDSTWKLLKRSWKDVKKEGALLKEPEKQKFERADYPAQLRVGIESVRVGVIASIKEVYAMIHSDISGVLEKIHSCGIGISIIHAVDDNIFPMDKIQKMVKIKMIDGFYSVWGSHNNIHHYKSHCRAPEIALTDLEKKQKNKKESLNKESL